MSSCKYHKGAALIISMIFVLVFSALAVSMATLSDVNMQIAENQRKADCTRGSAQSGLEISRLWLNQVSILGDTPEDQQFDLIAGCFQSAVTDISNITPAYDGSSITIPSVTLNLAMAQNFSAQITQIGPNTLQVDVTGVHGELTKTISVNYVFGTRAHTVFDFGVATKGSLSLAGNVELEGANVSVESGVYIESDDSLLALSMTGNSQIAGDVSIANPGAYVNIESNCQIGGETGQDAVDNHVSFGAPSTEFPTPNPTYFEHYATNIVDSSTDTSI
ncbi:MAG: pilus assembly PilX N-terminal domain-containing protein, partial [Planctomycetota bacterium]